MQSILVLDSSQHCIRIITFLVLVVDQKLLCRSQSDSELVKNLMITTCSTGKAFQFHSREVVRQRLTNRKYQHLCLLLSIVAKDSLCITHSYFLEATIFAVV